MCQIWYTYSEINNTENQLVLMTLAEEVFNIWSFGKKKCGCILQEKNHPFLKNHKMHNTKGKCIKSS